MDVGNRLDAPGALSERRRAALRAGAVTGSTLNGIDFLEVDGIGPIGGEQRRLRITFVNTPDGKARRLRGLCAKVVRPGPVRPAVRAPRMS